MTHGFFIITLDFELLWGTERAKASKEWKTRVKNVHHIIPEMLKLFDKYGVSATFATVGMIFHPDIVSCKKNIPEVLPTYDDIELSPYPFINSISESEHIYYCGRDLIKMIQTHKQHEIASHTYSHYYCLAKGQTGKQFRADLQKNIEVAANENIQLESLVFPRNEFNPEYLDICHECGIKSVRSNPESWIWKKTDTDNLTGKVIRYIKRLIRLCNIYFGPKECFSIEQIKRHPIIQIPASRFLRPYSKKLAFMETIKLHRIKSEMDYAAHKGLCYHLWWHPHNMGMNMDENLRALENILAHFSKLNDKYDFQSITMSSFCNNIR